MVTPLGLSSRAKRGGICILPAARTADSARQYQALGVTIPFPSPLFHLGLTVKCDGQEVIAQNRKLSSPCTARGVVSLAWSSIPESLALAQSDRSIIIAGSDRRFAGRARAAA